MQFILFTSNVEFEKESSMKIEVIYSEVLIDDDDVVANEFSNLSEKNSENKDWIISQTWKASIVEAKRIKLPERTLAQRTDARRPAWTFVQHAEDVRHIASATLVHGARPDARPERQMTLAQLAEDADPEQKPLSSGGEKPGRTLQLASMLVLGVPEWNFTTFYHPIHPLSLL
ncbi:hypothetical protein LR48_Vigan07g046500 [Vigna angularis]|uniref:Uncharacterized protein n=1 Tax=Phaseolus angularis TaxID=3914 RepID=A0A0L9UVK2_PHAAN|nr:hypothetical protein LR48_Vigan07g046500 [Vigna angularis]